MADHRVLFLDEFKKSFDPSNPESDYMFFAVPGIVKGDDGKVEIKHGALNISSSPFKFSLSNGLDHVKHLSFKKIPFQVPTNGQEIVFETTMSVKQTGLETIPASLLASDPDSMTGISKPHSDPRPCCGAFNVVDFTNLIVIDFIITDDQVFALAERLPFNLVKWGGTQLYNSYTHLIPVYKRDQCKDRLDDFVDLAISYNYQTATFRWFVNGCEVYRIDNPGHLLESRYRIIQITPIGAPIHPQVTVRSPTLNVGFGTFSLLEAVSPNNKDGVDNPGLVDFSMNGYFPYTDPNAPPGTPLTYLKTYQDLGTTCFGQGCDMRIKRVKVYTRSSNMVMKAGLCH